MTISSRTKRPSELVTLTHFFAKCAVFFGAVVLFPALAQAASSVSGSTFSDASSITSTDFANHPLMMMFALAALSMLPFVGMLVTSFVKMAVVLSITRQAVGLQQSPPTPVITGLALLLTVYVMYPVGLKIYERTDRYFKVQSRSVFDPSNVDLIFKAMNAGEAPLREFLIKHASEKDVQMFYNIAQRMRPAAERNQISPRDFMVVIPAFVISELTKAFQIGFIIFLPFLIVDLVVSNILMALGMQMLSPTTISLPFKILLFVMVDGWYLITKGLVLGYQV